MVRALVSVWLKRGQSSFNVVMENAKNHSQLNNQVTALGPEINLRVMSVSLIENISNQGLHSTF